MTLSIFDLFSVGIGPSSSHTIGPMRATKKFLQRVEKKGLLDSVASISIELFGSLAFTGKNHGTDKAVILGLEGCEPETIEITEVISRMSQISEYKQIALLGKHTITFVIEKDIIYNLKELLPFHANGMLFKGYDNGKKLINQRVYYSIGGGFILDEDQAKNKGNEEPTTDVPYPFLSAKELIQSCRENNLEISDLIMENEMQFRSKEKIREKLLNIISIMEESIKRGCELDGILPGPIKLQRRAKALLETLQKNGKPTSHTSMDCIAWMDLYALAVSEQNAAGDRIVTAPTNGASGIIPAVMFYYRDFYPNVTEESLCKFILTAGAIASLYKRNASISGAEVGCQGEVGVASSMAAGALAAVLGGTLDQIENAAEIAMEHSLGMTCDPLAGLVQVPCIERNAMGAVKALNACQLALMSDNPGIISLDRVIETMLQTGRDMNSKYKETSKGGLAVSLPEC